MLCDVNAEKGEAVAAEIGDGAVYRDCDVTDEAAVEAAVAATVSEFGSIDGAFNCAGILGVVGNIGELPLDGWKQLIDVDLNGVFLCTKHEVNAMAEQGSGAILNMSSAAGLIGWPGASGYVAAKHAVVGLTKVAALEYAEQGLREINALSPSYVITPLVEKDLFEDTLGNDEELIAAARANHPIGRFAQPPEIAAAAVAALRQGVLRDRHGDVGRRRLHRALISSNASWMADRSSFEQTPYELPPGATEIVLVRHGAAAYTGRPQPARRGALRPGASPGRVDAGEAGGGGAEGRADLGDLHLDPAPHPGNRGAAGSRDGARAGRALRSCARSSSATTRAASTGSKPPKATRR